MKQRNIAIIGLCLLVFLLTFNVYAVDCVGSGNESCDFYDADQAGCNGNYTMYINDYFQCVYNETAGLCGRNTENCTVPTTTTTTTPPTTTTVVPYHPGGYGNLGQLWIFTILFPVFALILTIASIAFKHPLLSFLAALFWFASSLTTSNIIFVGEFGYDTTYTALGNPEWNQLYNGLGVVMVLYTIGLIVNTAYTSGRIGVKRDRGRD